MTSTETIRILSPDDILFTEATPEQLTTVWQLNAQAWAAPISVADHIERERTLSQQPLTKTGHWRTWIIVPKDDHNEIVSSVETFAKPIFVSDQDGFREEWGYGIASVYTNPKYRGQRMSVLLLERLKEWMDGEGQGCVSVLYSDVGRV